MLGAGTFINPIIKIVTSVAILAAVGLFIVKPILDTTEEISRGINESIGKSLEGDDRQIERSLGRAERIVERASARNYSFTAEGEDADRLIRCIQRASGEVARIQACGKRFGS